MAKTKALKYEAELQLFFATRKKVTWDLVGPNEMTPSSASLGTPVGCQLDPGSRKCHAPSILLDFLGGTIFV